MEIQKQVNENKKQFYIVFPIGATASHQLSWSHYFEFVRKCRTNSSYSKK